jgi:hypothetical protein
MDISANDFNATPVEIGQLTRVLLAGTNAVDTGRVTYLRCLVDTTQRAMKLKAKIRPGRERSLEQAERDAQFAALIVTHEAFYGAVVKAVTEEGAKGKELNRQTNFARTALYAVRTWLRAGHDLGHLIPSQVTKTALHVEREIRPLSPRRMLSRVERESKKLFASVIGLIEVDPKAAVTEIGALVGQLEHELTQLTKKAPKEKVRAVARRAHNGGKVAVM